MSDLPKVTRLVRGTLVLEPGQSDCRAHIRKPVRCDPGERRLAAREPVFPVRMARGGQGTPSVPPAANPSEAPGGE